MSFIHPLIHPSNNKMLIKWYKPESQQGWILPSINSYPNIGDKVYVQKLESESKFNQCRIIKVLWKNKKAFLMGVTRKGIFGTGYGILAWPGRKGRISIGGRGDGSFQAEEADAMSQRNVGTYHASTRSLKWKVRWDSWLSQWRGKLGKKYTLHLIGDREPMKGS